MRRPVALAVAAVSLAGGFLLGPRVTVLAQSSSERTKTVWSGVYTDDQATHGQAEYDAHCASCHEEDLSGYQSILKGERFMNDYREATLYQLFDKIKSTMPRSAGGSLSDQAYLDIVAYILKSNDFPAGPAGDAGLRLDTLPAVLVTRKNGPEAVPNFSLVRIVGCLAEREADSTWVLTHASEPVRTGHPQRTADEPALEPVGMPGGRTVSLMVSPAYDPRPYRGTEIEARGFLIRRPTEDRINLTSLETISQRCRE